MRSSFHEAVYTLKMDKFSEIKAQGTENEEFLKLKQVFRNYVKYGPFTLGGNKCEIRAYPWLAKLRLAIYFLDTLVTFKKYGYILLIQDHGGWRNLHSTKPNDESSIVSSSSSPGAHAYAHVGAVEYKDVQDDCTFLKIVFWGILDDSQNPANLMLPAGSGPNQQPSPHYPKRPNYSTPDFISTLLNGQFADIHFTVKDQVFPAHWAVLAARSSVFKSEILALQSESEEDMCWNRLHVSVQHMDALTFKYLLHFIYTDSLPPDFEEATPPERYHLMFIAAHCFKIERLKSICEEKLTMDVAQTIGTTLKLIEHQECGLLKIVPKATSVPIMGDRLCGTSITK